MYPHASPPLANAFLSRRPVLVLASITVILLALFSPILAMPAEPAATNVSVVPASFTIQGCETIEIEVWINDVVDLYSADIRLSFDPAILEVVDSDPGMAGVQVANGGFLAEPVSAAANDADNTAGTIIYAATQLNPTPPANGSGPFIVIQFRAKQAGTSAIHITYTQVMVAFPAVLLIPRIGRIKGPDML